MDRHRIPKSMLLLNENFELPLFSVFTVVPKTKSNGSMVKTENKGNSKFSFD